MYAEKLLLTTDAKAWITELPQFESNQKVELIASKHLVQWRETM